MADEAKEETGYSESEEEQEEDDDGSEEEEGADAEIECRRGDQKALQA